MSVFGRYLSRHRAFWIALLCSAILWFVSVMSDTQTNEYTVRIAWQGFDTARYVVASADTSIRVAVTSNGFSSLGRDRHVERQHLHLTTTGDTTFYGGDLSALVVSQLGLRGVRSVEVRSESVSLHLSPRARRGYVPQLKGLRLSFAEPYGICGTPIVRPDTVWLYGSAEVLSQIDEVATEPAEISGISSEALITLPLSPVWRHYPNVYTSTQSVTVEIPTAVYSERSFLLPVEVEGADDGHQVRLFPEQARVTLWVANQGEHQLATDMVHLAVDFAHRDISSDQLNVRVAAFPEFVRVKKVEPETVRYVVIK